ncbi:transcriptional regulator [Clostridium butyricum]|uniref:Transcriptional regulator n=1 Tax=Clostridium butyricum TaxID=1492 RepID=A0A6L9EUZ5_CLOBU|nr:transcriptional regulator [Clostridium butyricum]
MLGLEYILAIYNMQHIELAEKLEIKKQNINLWIKRKQNIPNKYLPVLEELFGVKKEYFTKELDEIEKLEIQKEKLKKELNPVIEKQEQQLKIGENTDFDYVPIYDKEEINQIDRNIEKAKLIAKFTNALNIVENNPYIETFKLLVELVDKKRHEPILQKTIEALAHYLEVLPAEISSSEEQDEFESEIFEIFDDNNF